ncbi:fibronectin type 3 domain-containing protein [Aureococcus anophagefferens]|nr:fibronectin type 3 domain-containing protein [Aureococcus anophagefferens]
MGSFTLVRRRAVPLALALCSAAAVEYFVPDAPRQPPTISNVTTSSMMLHWEPVDARLSYPVDAYEVEVMSLQERHLGWRSLDDAVETVKPRNEVQTINIRVDKGSTVAGGYFQIYAAFDGISPLNTDAVAYTSEIPYDATAAEVKAAIEGLENVDALVHVIRCGGVGLRRRRRLGRRLPFGAYGAYSWHVEFDTPRTEATAYDGALREFNQPTLDLRAQAMARPCRPRASAPSRAGHLQGDRQPRRVLDGARPGGLRVGAGSSLPCGAAVAGVAEAPVSGVVGGGGRPPPAPLCAYNATSLAHPGGLYAFRIAAQRRGALPRGSAVFYASTPPNAAQQAAASAPPAATYELQYRQDEAAPWVDAPAPIDVDGSGWATATLYGLEAGAAVFAIAAAAAGASPWSLSSNGGVATRDPKPPVPSAPVATLDGGDGAILVRFLPFAADGLGSRSATVARHFELGTQAWKGRGFAAPVGWDVAYDRPLPYVLTDAVDEIQLATSRCDAGAISGGTFRLRLPVRGAYERGTVTGDLPFDASAFAVKKALEALDVVPEGSLAVTRHTPGALESHAPARGAFAWKVHFKDIGAVAGADLRATGVFPALEPENVDLSCAYSGDGVGVVVERLQVGSLETYRDALDAEVFNVEPNTRYRFRARAVDGRGAASEWSAASAWVATNDALRVFETVGRSTQRRAEARSLRRPRWAGRRAADPDYVGGAGGGGDGDGNGGLVVLAAYDGAAAHLIRARAASSTRRGGPRPRRAGGSGRPGAKRLVAKLWGGGGGGAGAGRGEANATSRATEALVDDLRLDNGRAPRPSRTCGRDRRRRRAARNLGGAGGSGKEGGGGGGGGYFGAAAAARASTRAAAAAGRGSADLAYRPVEALGALSPPTPVVADANHSAVSLAWPPNDAATYFWAERYHVEMAEGGVGGFKLVVAVAAATAASTMGAQTGLGADDAASESAAGRAADAPTEFYPSAPSGRQGHSLTRLGGAPEIRAYRLPSAELGAVFLFGGHGDGYECGGAVARRSAGAYRWRGFDNERCEPDPRYVEDGDLEFAYYRDLWLLDVGAPRRATWSWTAGSAVDPVFVPDARTTYFDVNVTAGDEWCLRDVDIYVRISHPCASQLSISVVGPGPCRAAATSATRRGVVARAAPRAGREFEACDRLDPPFSTQDALNDFGYKGDPGMLFGDAPVDVRARAKNPTAAPSGPSTRSPTSSSTAGGPRRTVPDKALWRYDILTSAWTALSAAPQPEGVYDPVGKAAVITPWGIYAFGGLGGWHDERGLPCFAVRRRALARHALEPLPGVADVVSAAADVRAGLLPDTDAAVPPAILLFGGDDDFSDLDDAWLLKLGNASLRHTSDPRFEFHLSPSFHFAFCGWRFQGKSRELWDASCGANATTSPMEDCEFVEVVQRAYCEHQYQSLNHLPY